MRNKGFSFSAEEVLEKITPQTRLMIINSPANPTGGVVPRAELDRLVAGLERHPQVAVMSDEIYGEILYDGAEHVSLLHYPSLRERLILLDGWSKTYAMTGWRMGYGVWPRAVFPSAERLAINCHSCVNAAAQFAGIAALEGPREPVHRMVRAFAERREVIVAALNSLPGVSCATPGGAFYTFPNISGTGHDARSFQSQAARRGGRRDDRRHQLWRIRRGLYPFFLRQQPGGDHRGDGADPAFPRQYGAPRCSGGMII